MAIDTENFDWALKKAKKAVPHLSPALLFTNTQKGTTRVALTFTVPDRAFCSFVLTKPPRILDIDTELSIFLIKLKKRHPAAKSADVSAERIPCRAG